MEEHSYARLDNASDEVIDSISRRMRRQVAKQHPKCYLRNANFFLITNPLGQKAQELVHPFRNGWKINTLGLSDVILAVTARQLSQRKAVQRTDL